FNETGKEDVLTVMEAGKILGLSKDHMTLYVEKNRITKVPIARSVHRYLLLKSEIEQIAQSSKFSK
ncbi:MAG TPA: DNA-binding protein, partial [Candidatus Paenibacillus intestinavium]|nr:DNA-binding protein [Candidatus Paenibacillus intestinavium]